MSEKPILFNTKMVRAILDGRKTTTRRIIRVGDGWEITGIPLFWIDGHATVNETVNGYPFTISRETVTYDDQGFTHKVEVTNLCIVPPYKAGDVLYVRETWKQYTTGTAGPGLIDGYLYKANEPQDTTGMMVEDRWHPSIHMPKKAARIYLKVNRVYPAQLQDMTEEDAMSEGFPDTPAGEPSPLESFIDLWAKTLKHEELNVFGWDANPWVWVIDFERIDGGPAGLFADRDTAQYADAGILNPAT